LRNVDWQVTSEQLDRRPGGQRAPTRAAGCTDCTHGDEIAVSEHKGLADDHCPGTAINSTAEAGAEKVEPPLQYRKAIHSRYTNERGGAGSNEGKDFNKPRGHERVRIDGRGDLRARDAAYRSGWIRRLRAYPNVVTGDLNAHWSCGGRNGSAPGLHPPALQGSFKQHDREKDDSCRDEEAAHHPRVKQGSNDEKR
jgi:hypothetical protein